MIPQNIDWTELLSNTFSSSTIAQTQVRTHPSNTYIIQLTWDHVGLPLNQQVIWLLYNPESIKPIEKLLEDLRHLARATDHKLVIIDDYDPARHYLMEIMICCDGYATTQTYIHQIDDYEGYIGVITGQGRTIDVQEPRIRATIHATLSNILLGIKPLQDDTYLNNGRKTLNHLVTTTQKNGANIRSMTQNRLRTEASHRDG